MYDKEYQRLKKQKEEYEMKDVIMVIVSGISVIIGVIAIAGACLSENVGDGSFVLIIICLIGVCAPWGYMSSYANEQARIRDRLVKEDRESSFNRKIKKLAKIANGLRVSYI
ncbi:MAG: hypothetical protein K6G88_03935 [Lachnospiraceae bacterium]|nr:hypothetical protein [Lachnospiraceae bacterium]